MSETTKEEKLSLSELSAEIGKDGVKDYEVTVRTTTLSEHFSTWEVWIFIILAIIVLVACFFIAYQQQDWFADIKKVDWAQNLIAWGVGLIIVYLVMALCSSFAYVKTLSQQNKMAILITFLISSGLLILWFTLFFFSKDLSSAFYTTIALIVVTVVLTYFVFLSDIGSGIGMLPYIVFLLFLSGIGWNIMASNVTGI